MDIKQRLISQSEKDFQKFSASLIPNINNVLGVRIPTLRKIAKEIYRSGDWENFVNRKNCEYMEEVMLQGMVIGLIKQPPQKILQYIKNFIPKIDNWAVCDTLVFSSKIMSKERNCFFRKGRILIRSKEPFVARVGFVIFLTHCVTGHYPKQMFPLITHYQSDSYYVGMAIAWLLSVLLIDFYDETKVYLEENHLSKFILQKTVSKACDSYRLSKEQKDELRALKKRLIH